MMDALSFVKFSELQNWSVQYTTQNLFHYANHFPLETIGMFLFRVKEKVDVEDDTSYKRLTIKSKNGGVVVRDELIGRKIGTKQQYLVRSGQFALSKIDARNGAFGVVPEDANNAIITSNFWTYDVDYNLINPFFLSLLTTTKSFIDFAEKSSNGTTNRHYLQESLFLSQRVPLPSMSQQNEIVFKYNQAIAEAEAKEAQAERLENEIEQYLLGELRVDIHYKEKDNHFGPLHIVHSKTLSKWGYDYLSDRNGSILDSKLYNNVPLRKLMDVNPSTSLSILKEDEDISFIPMECVSDVYGEIIEQRIVKSKQSKGYTKFQDGDLIWAKITPCMQNGKSAIVRDLQNGFGCGSTEFHVLRKSSPEILTEFVYCLLRTQYILEDAKKYFTGSAGQQRVPKTYLQQLAIPLPPIDIQNSIVAHIAEMKAQIKLLKQQAAELRDKALKDFENEIFE